MRIAASTVSTNGGGESYSAVVLRRDSSTADLSETSRKTAGEGSPLSSSVKEASSEVHPLDEDLIPVRSVGIPPRIRPGGVRAVAGIRTSRLNHM